MRAKGEAFAATMIVAFVACAGPPARHEPPRPVVSSPPPAEGTWAPPVTASAMPAALSPTAEFGDRRIETACNGLDDDGDGLTDLLLPVAPNVCKTELPGACTLGYA